MVMYTVSSLVSRKMLEQNFYQISMVEGMNGASGNTENVNNMCKVAELLQGLDKI